MGFYDKENMFSEDQAITASAKSSNALNLGLAGIGPGEPIEVDIQVTEDFNNLTSLKVELRVDTVEAMSSPTTLVEATVLIADLVAGKKIPIERVPAGTEQYADLYYTVTGTTPTAGKIWAGLALDRQSNV